MRKQFESVLTILVCGFLSVSILLDELRIEESKLILVCLFLVACIELIKICVRFFRMAKEQRVETKKEQR